MVLTAIVLNVLLVLFLVLLNGFFVAAEFALVKVRQSRLMQLVDEGKGQAKHALAVTKRLDAYLSATQLGITLASLGLGYAGEPAVNHLMVEPLLGWLGLERASYSSTLAFAITFAVITFLHIVLGELAPKSLAIQKSETVSIWLSGPLMIFYNIFMPAIWLLNGAANKLLRLLGVQPASEHEAHTEEEIRILMNQSARSGHIDKDEMVLFDNIFEYSDRLAREVMLPRIDMDCLYTNLPLEQNLQHVFQTKHTRYPVAAEGDKDRIIGFVHITDLLTAPAGEELRLETYLRPVLTVPESMEISHVMRLMQKRRAQIAIVIDEYGGTAGMLTTEDILEEIVGEIRDEFDEDEREDVEVKGQTISVDGRMLLEEINDMLDIEIIDEEVDSIGGWLFKQLEGQASKGARIEQANYTFEVAEVDRLRIVRVHIHRLAPKSASGEQQHTDEPHA
ncbi:hemolysin family protein [Paenibacillus sp. y28]|uniref:hemolysin family protein n=1 Tax=Paenibacillus sp. y28 TaxID=3129110 RepID=UPI00301A9C87